MTSPSQNVTDLLVAWSNGDPQAFDELMPLIYPELKRMARKHLGRERIGHTLQTKALVNEAYLRLIVNRTSIGRTAHTFTSAIPRRFQKRSFIAN